MEFDPDFMEVLNGVCTLVAVWVMIFFGRYIWLDWREHHDKFRIAGAVAIFTVFAGQFMLRGTVWIQRHMVNNWGLGFNWEALAPVLALGGFTLILGSLCMVRVFAPEGTGWGWVVVAGLTSLLGAFAINALV